VVPLEISSTLILDSSSSHCGIWRPQENPSRGRGGIYDSSAATETDNTAALVGPTWVQ
jgi:hypothetical protein